MELIVVSPPDYFEGEAALINQFFAEGLSLFHIRKPVNNREKFRCLLMNINAEFYPRIAIHQHHELAEEFALERLHFTEQQRKSISATDWKNLTGRGFHLSSSVHELSTIPALTDLDYAFFGPVFNSISKDGYCRVVDDEFVLQAHTTRIFAIGGVGVNNLKKIKAMNFDGATVLGSLWHQQESPLSELKKILNTLKEINNGD